MHLPWPRKGGSGSRRDRKLVAFVLIMALSAGGTVTVFRHEIAAAAIRLTPSIASWWSGSLSVLARLLGLSPRRAGSSQEAMAFGSGAGPSSARPPGSSRRQGSAPGADRSYADRDQDGAKTANPFAAGADARERGRSKRVAGANGSRPHADFSAVPLNWDQPDSLEYVVPRAKDAAPAQWRPPPEPAEPPPPDAQSGASTPKRRRTGPGFDGQPQPGEDGADDPPPPPPPLVRPPPKIAPAFESAARPAPPPPPAPGAPPAAPSAPAAPTGHLSEPVDMGQVWQPWIMLVVGLGGPIPAGYACSIDHEYFANLVTNPDGSAKLASSSPPAPADCVKSGGACFLADRMRQTCQ